MPEDTEEIETTSSPLSQVKDGATSKGPVDLRTTTNALVGDQLKNLEDNRSQKKSILDKAIANLEARLPQPGSGPSAEELLRLSAAFGAPTKTGGFGETLANVSGAGADLVKARRENKTNLEDLKTKYQLQGLDVDSDYLKQALSAHKELSTGGVQSNYGKQALDEGLVPGSPSFVARIKELAQYDIDAKIQKSKGTDEGTFDKKTGNFITPGGTVIPKTEVSKDRESRQKLIDQKEAFKKIDKKTINQAVSTFDVTGAGSTGILGKGIASVVSPDTLDAQTKVYGQALEGIMKALPPGPATDKDVNNARATFPGFGSKKALKNWLTSLEEMVDRHLKMQDEKYGSSRWYGASGTPTSSAKDGGRNELGETPAERERLKNPAPVPKVGAVLHGHKFKGGDPAVESNWEKI